METMQSSATENAVSVSGVHQRFNALQDSFFKFETKLIEWHKKLVLSWEFPKDKINLFNAIIISLVAYGIGIFARYWYLIQHGSNELILIDENPMFVSPDAYYYAEYVLNVLREGWTDNNMKGFSLPGFSTLYVLSVYICKIFNLHPSEILVYIPIFVAPLVVFPTIAIGRLLGSTLFGFFSAILLSIASIYFRRTRMGYYDSDLFTLAALLTGLYVGMLLIRNPSYLKILLFIFLYAIYPFFDKVVMANVFFVMTLGLFMLRWHKHDKFHSMLLLLMVPGLQLAVFPTLLLAAGVLIVLWLLEKYGVREKLDSNRKLTPYFLLLATFVILFNELFITAYNYFNLYILRNTIGNAELVTRDSLLAFKISTSTISELQTRDFFPLSFEVASAQHYVTWAIMGYLLLLFIYPVSVFLLPFVFLGLMATVAGVRFSFFLAVVYPFGLTFFAYFLHKLWHKITNTSLPMYFLIVVAAHVGFLLLLEFGYFLSYLLSQKENYPALSIYTLVGGRPNSAESDLFILIATLYPIVVSFFVIWIRKSLSEKFVNNFSNSWDAWVSRRSVWMENSLRFILYTAPLCTLLGLAIYPSFSMVKNFSARVLSESQSFEPLQTAAKIGNNNDMIYTWWDYGYLLRYFSNMNTIVDGRQPNIDDYIISKVFASDSPRLMANMLRYVSEKQKFVKYESLLVNVVADYRHKSRVPFADLFVERMRSPSFRVNDYVTKTRDAYVYMNHYFLLRHSVIKSFANQSLEDKAKRLNQNQFYFYSRSYSSQKLDGRDVLRISATRWVDLQSGYFYDTNANGEQVSVRINSLHHGRKSDQGYDMQRFGFDPKSNIYVVALPTVGVYMMDKKNFDANYIQMFVFNNYDERFYEVIERNSTSVLFRLKI